MELPDWVCCGASSAHETNHLLALSLPARELASAANMGWPVVAACAMCFSRLKTAAAELENDGTRAKVSEIVGKKLPAGHEVYHLLQVVDQLRGSIGATSPLHGLKVASYYGCVLVRPKGIARMDDVENPQIMDRIVRAVGAEPVDWAFKTECCGAGMALPHPEIMMKLTHRILSQAKQAGADCVTVACPLCHSNLDSYQKQMNKVYVDKTNIPIFYFTELVGLSMGFSPRALHLDKHFTDPLPLLKDRGLLKGPTRG